MHSALYRGIVTHHRGSPVSHSFKYPVMMTYLDLADQRYERYRRSVDFIQRYIFPGGCLPSVGALIAASTSRTSWQLTNLEDFANDYALTLEQWRKNFHANIVAIRELGMSERLIRTWHFYFCYCEAAFREQAIGLKQIVFVKAK